jgi:hypothetical protein
MIVEVIQDCFSRHHHEEDMLLLLPLPSPVRSTVLLSLKVEPRLVPLMVNVYFKQQRTSKFKVLSRDNIATKHFEM